MAPFLSACPPLTEANLVDQSGKVFIVTGATSGYGLLLSTILYQRNGKVYLAARNSSKIQEVIQDLRNRFPDSRGDLQPLALDLSDLSTIKKSADEFLSKEKQLHVLWNNAGVMFPPAGSRTAQGYELQLGTNVLGPFLFTKLLYPLLAQTAAASPPKTVRIVWVASDAVSWAPKPAIDFSNLDYHKDETDRVKYGRSKAGTILQSVEMAKRGQKDGVMSVVLDPGIAMTGLQRDMPRWLTAAVRLMAQKPITGAYTQLFAGLQPGLDIDSTTKWVVPPGKITTGRKDIFEDAELGRKFWDWNEEQVAPYL